MSVVSSGIFNVLTFFVYVNRFYLLSKNYHCEGLLYQIYIFIFLVWKSTFCICICNCLCFLTLKFFLGVGGYIWRASLIKSLLHSHFAINQKFTFLNLNYLKCNFEVSFQILTIDLILLIAFVLYHNVQRSKK